MTKFVVIYERESAIWFRLSKSYVGFEIIKDVDFTSAYHHVIERLKAMEHLHKNLLRLHIQTLEQVNDDFKASDVRIASLAEIEEEYRHSEAMAKAKGGEKKE